MADYREHYPEIRRLGASLTAVSVDRPQQSERLRHELDLPFGLLCDVGRSVVRAWDIYNPRERGGIARPATFVIGNDRTVRYATRDGVARRVPAAEIIRVLQQPSADARRITYLPHWADWFRAIRNGFRH